MRFSRLFGFPCPRCGRVLRFKQLGPRFRCRVCDASLRSNAWPVRIGMSLAVVAVLVGVVALGVWQAIFVAILPVWAFRQLFTTVELDEDSPGR